MAVVIRLSRVGAKKKPVFHIVVANEDSPRDGKYLERIGLYDPTKKEDKDKVQIDLKNAIAWQKKGALVSETVGHLIKIATKYSS